VIEKIYECVSLIKEPDPVIKALDPVIKGFFREVFLHSWGIIINHFV